jgi:AraC family transcriptional regulator
MPYPNEPRIETLPGKKFIGKKIIMSFYDNKTFDLWSSFMPRRNEIRNNIGSGLWSIQVYGPSFFTHFNPESEFEKWAAIEVPDFWTVPLGMEPLVLPGGLYAVFLHKGPASRGPETFGYIFGTWLPGSDYLLDDRPHFEILGEKYKHEDPESEEEVWIPVRPKS